VSENEIGEIKAYLAYPPTGLSALVKDWATDVLDDINANLAVPAFRDRAFSVARDRAARALRNFPADDPDRPYIAQLVTLLEER
jgi:hypothetical protein